MKKFCKDCKFLHVDSSEYGGWDYCKAFPNLMFSAMRACFRDPECEEVNKDNDCDAYKKKVSKWRFLKRIIRRMVKQ